MSQGSQRNNMGSNQKMSPFTIWKEMDKLLQKLSWLNDEILEGVKTQKPVQLAVEDLNDCASAINFAGMFAKNEIHDIFQKTIYESFNVTPKAIIVSEEGHMRLNDKDYFDSVFGLLQMVERYPMESDRLNQILKGHSIKEVIDLVMEYVQIDVRRKFSFPNEELNDDPGYVYFAKDTQVTGFTKIGRTKDVKKRIIGLNTASPFKVELIHFISCKDFAAAERYFHGFYKDKRKHGEWFDLQDEDFKLIRTIESL